MEECLICIDPKWPQNKLTKSYFGDISANNKCRIMVLVSNHMFLGVKESDEHRIKHLRPSLDNINGIFVNDECRFA